MLFAAAVITASAVDPASLKPQGYVSDFAHVLDDPSRAEVENYCGRIEQATGVQMALVTIDSLDGAPIEDFTNTLFRQWGVGRKSTNEGVMLLLAIHDRKDRIEVGYGLEPSLPDGFVGSILRDMRPQLEAGNYGAALMAGAESMGSRIAQAKNVSLNFGLEQPRPTRQVHDTGDSFPWPVLIIGIIILLSIFGRRGGGFFGGGPGGLLTGMLLGNMMGRSSRWGGGGFGGFDSGGGGGGGGFGGFGGGDSGGGGASGSW